MSKHPYKKKKDLIPPPLPPLLVSKEDARYYLGGICPKTLQRLINHGRLPTTKMRGRTMIPYFALVKLANKGANFNEQEKAELKIMEEKKRAKVDRPVHQ